MIGVRGLLKEYGMSLGLAAITIPLIPYAGLDPTYIIQELITRLGRNAILVLGLLPMLYAGMGFNFALGAGAMAAQIGMILAVAFNLVGLYGLAFAVLAGLPIAVFVGWITGSILNRAKGMEMILSFLLVPFFYGFYQLLVLDGMGAAIPIPATDLLLKRGYGIRNTVTLSSFHQALDGLIPFRLGDFTFPIGTYLVIATMALLILWLLRSKLGHDIRAVGSDPQAAEAAGICVEHTRIQAVILSMVLACIGQVVFLQNMGAMGTYIAHTQTAYFAIPALMIGGAALRRIKIRHALIGIPVLHAFLVISPSASCQIFGSAQLSDYLRQFIMYAIIAVGLVRYGMEKSREAEQKRKEKEVSVAAGSGHP